MWALGLPRYTATVLRSCARIGDRRLSISVSASSQPAGRSSPFSLISGVETRSGSSCSALSADPLGQMKPRLNTSALSPRIETTCSSASSLSSKPQVASHSGQVR
jgi:hypothetical protein